MPHVTVSGPLSSPERAIAALLAQWTPLADTLNEVDLVHLRPVVTLWSRMLPV
jgi:hypothetical protein